MRIHPDTQISNWAVSYRSIRPPSDTAVHDEVFISTALEAFKWEASEGHLPPSPNTAVLFAKFAWLLPVSIVKEPRSAAKAPALTNGERPSDCTMKNKTRKVVTALTYRKTRRTVQCGSPDEGLTTKCAGEVELEARPIGHSSIRTHGEYCSCHHVDWTSLVRLAGGGRVQTSTDLLAPLRSLGIKSATQRISTNGMHPVR